MSNLPEIDFHKIRTHRGTQHGGFEELSVQIFRSEITNAIELNRVEGAGGDGGVEAFAVFPNGQKIGLQAKFFDDLGPKQWHQISKSVHSALDNYSKLIEYRIAVPLDRTPAQKKKWDLLVTQWQASAATKVRDETLQDERIIEGLEMDIVSHDVRKFFGLLLKKNGYALEQVFSPLIVHTTPEHEELKGVCRTGRLGVITKHHAHHYFGFAETQWKLFLKESPRRVKPLLYVYRVLLTGIHLMRTGEIEANLVTLNEAFRLPYIPDLVARKLAGPENQSVGHLLEAEVGFHEAEYQRLRVELQAAHEASPLPDLPSDKARAALNDLLVRLRLRR